MMRKTMFSGNRFIPDEEEPTPERTLREFVARLREILPATWSVEPEVDVRVRSGSDPAGFADALVTIQAPDGTRAVLVVEAKRRVDPKLVPYVADQIERKRDLIKADASLVVGTFLSPRARKLLTEKGIGFADATGALLLALDSPALYVHTEGAASDPWERPGDRPLKSLKGPTAGRVIRALCDFRPPYGVEQLARRSQTSLGSVSRVIALLESEALISRAARGPITDVRWADLLRRWTQDYAFARTNTTRMFLEPRGLPALLDKLRKAPDRYAVTGSFAGAQVAAIAVPRLLAAYVDDIETAAEKLGLRRAETAANVILARPFDPVVYDRRQEKEGVEYAAFSQVAADLLTGPGRGPAEGEELIRWMHEHEDDWRS
jgi:hypothetical protein